MFRLNLYRRSCKTASPPFVLTIAMLMVCSAVTEAVCEPSGKMNLEQAQASQRALVDKAEAILSSQGDWSAARKLLEEARTFSVTTTGGMKNPLRSKEADFYYSWILCQTADEKEKGLKLLNKTLKNYSWSQEKRAILEKQLAECGAAMSPKLIASKESFVIAAVQKGGYWSMPVQLQSRNLLPPATWDNIVESKTILKTILGQSYNVIDSEPFLVAGTFSDYYLKQLADTVLNPYFNYLRNSMEIVYDGNPIFVFVAGNHEQFSKMTNRMYQVNDKDRYAPAIAIAFSDLPNATMMAICGKEASNCTSLAHELFHILNAKSFEDAPWWLYEGTAELFESGNLSKDVFRARAGWRKSKAAINKFSSKALRELLNMSKNDPSLNSPPGNEIAMSRARFFCRYLHEKKMLWPIYHALKNRDWNDNAEDPAGIEVIEKTLNMGLEGVNADFRKWFNQVVAPEPGTFGP